MQAIEIWSVDKIKEKFPSKMKQKMKKGDQFQKVKPKGFLMFSGGIEKQYLAVMC